MMRTVLVTISGTGLESQLVRKLDYVLRGHFHGCQDSLGKKSFGKFCGLVSRLGPVFRVRKSFLG
jgi:hypothetical protein